MTAADSSAAWHANIPPDEKLVLLAIADSPVDATSDGETQIAQRTGIPNSDISRITRSLIAQGHLTTIYYNGRIIYMLNSSRLADYEHADDTQVGSRI